MQGEGRYVGYPALFIRLSGCTRECCFCDTKYHKEGKEIDVNEIIEKINNSKYSIVIWTGGEPLLQFSKIKEIVEKTNKQHHLETNGDLLKEDILQCFDYICVSPKDLKTAEKINKIKNNNLDIKIVTDLKLNKELIHFATMLMPLTTGNKNKNKEIEQKIWRFCVKNNIRFCLRQHINVWWDKRGV